LVACGEYVVLVLFGLIVNTFRTMDSVVGIVLLIVAIDNHILAGTTLTYGWLLPVGIHTGPCLFVRIGRVF
jgi:hypothetical protein